MSDIIIFYELPERELNNANLLKAEFERRGYTVDIKDYWNYREIVFPIKEKPKLVITQSGYDNSDLERFTLRFKPKIDKMLNMRYEQVISKIVLDSNMHYPREHMKNLCHICWSDNLKNELINIGIPSERLHVTGDIKTDFSHSRFDSFYKTKKELANEFNLDSDKEWILFISSFTFDENTPEKRLKKWNNNIKDGKYMQKWNIKTKKVVLEWIEKFIQTHPEKEFIYRPHPVEYNIMDRNRDLYELVEKYPNFHFISKYSIQEWIRPCDYLNTSFSTAIIDVYLLKKQCNILRPYPIDPDFDNPLLINAEAIDSYEEFERSNTQKSENPFPISDEEVSKYYHFGEKLAYENICDFAEKMIADDSYKADFYPSKSRFLRLKFIIRKSLTMPKIIPTVLKSALSNKSSASKTDKDTTYKINAEKINKIIKG